MELITFSAEKALEDVILLVNVVDYPLGKIATDTVIREKQYSLLDEILERINARYGYYADASKELQDIVATVSNDADMIGNVRDSSPSAYEAEAVDKIGKIFVSGILSFEKERSQFFAQLSNDKEIVNALAKAVIRRIKDDVLAS